jgi:glycosyltransferase involved in cell wall biosynthesis
MTLTVVIPCFNREQLLAATLRSLEDLGEAGPEVIVVDDGSTDRSVAVAQSELARLAEFGIAGRVEESRHGGACAARNKGLALARGECVMFLDSDDLVEACGILALYSQLISSPDTDIAYGWVWVRGSMLNQAWKKGIPLDGCRHRIFDQLWHTSGALYRRSLLEKCGGWNTSLTLGDDWEFGARTRLHAKDIVYVDRCVGSYVQHEGGRLSAGSFDRNKCRSVIRATVKIGRSARLQGATYRHLQRRVYRRLLVQSTELAINKGGYPAKVITRMCSRQTTDALSALIALSLRAFPNQRFRSWIYTRLRSKGLT